MTKCAKQHDDAEESYTWCRTGAHTDQEWDYCSLQVHKENHIGTDQNTNKSITIVTLKTY